MTDYSQLMKTLRIRGGKMNLASADAINALQARVAELEAEADQCSIETEEAANVFDGRGFTGLARVYRGAAARTRALLERKPS